MILNKKLVAGLTVATMLPVLAACGGGEEEVAEGEEEVETITIFQSKVEISDQLEAAAEAYEEETGIGVEVIGTTGDDYFEQLQIRLSNGTGPSIFSLQNASEAERLESYVYDLSGEAFTENIAPGMGLMLNDQLVGIPYGVEGFGLVYNSDLVNPEEDFADYESFASTLEELEAEGITGLSLSQEAYFLIGHILNYPFSLQENPVEFIEQLNAGEVNLADVEEFQEFGQFLETIRAQEVNPLEVTYDTQVGDFAVGQTAAIHQGNWVAPMLEDFGAEFEPGLAPFPLAGNDRIAVGVGNNWAVNGEKSPEEIAAAIAFLEWLHTSEEGMRIIVEEFGFIPAMTNIEAEGLDPISQQVLEASNSGETLMWSQNYFPPNIITNDLTPIAEEFFISEDMTGEEFITALDEAWDSAVAE